MQIALFSKFSTLNRTGSRSDDILRDAIHKSKTMPFEQIDKEYYKKKLHEALDADLSGYERKGAKDFLALQNGLINCEDYVFTFLEHEEVPHHNNSSEASIRVLKVKAKVSGGFRTQDGADEYAKVILSKIWFQGRANF